MSETLFSPGPIGPLTVNNRVVMPPMCMFAADETGMPNEFHYVHYVNRAMHQVGLVIVEATGVAPEGRITDADLGIWDDAFIPPFQRMVDECHRYGAKVLLQIAHAGRKCEVPDVTPLAPSAVKLDDRYAVPHAMTLSDIQSFIDQMQTAARRADQAGFDGVEIHAAHGYLLNQFLSPITNQRSDAYGGSSENRTRLLREVVEAVDAALPADKALVVRVSAEEYLEDGLHPQKVAEMLSRIPSGMIDAVDVSSGGLVSVSFPIYPGYQVKFAETIRALTGLPVITGGLIYDPLLANEIIANERAEFVFVGRGLLYDAAWVIKAQKRLGFDQTWPKPYQGALGRMNIQ